MKQGLTPQDVLLRMERAGIIPVAVIDDPAKAVQLGRSILDGGVDLIEVTMRTPRSKEAIEVLSRELPEILVGAGTVFSVPVAEETLSSGARFIVSPHLDEEIVEFCARNMVVSMPGVMTPSEVQRAIQAATRGYRFLHSDPPKSMNDLPLVVKVFPASTLGPGHISAMKAVFPNVKFLPLGGVHAKNLAEYLEAGAWAVGGTWICKRDLISTGSFAKITELVKEAKTIITTVRKSNHA
jgi:2-dehydro-3-deoxyphosphogluconate aldolase/(4S)-4-hydroxy-2-oxoglutarate aldolase